MSGCLWLSMFYHCLVRNGNKTVWLWIYVKKNHIGVEISTFTTLIMLKGEYHLSVMSSSDISSVTMVTCPWSPWLCVPQLWRNNQSTIAYSLMVSISDIRDFFWLWNDHLHWKMMLKRCSALAQCGPCSTVSMWRPGCGEQVDLNV